MVAIHLDEILYDSESDGYYSDDGQNRFTRRRVPLAPRRFVWEVAQSDDDDDDIDRPRVVGGIRRLEDDLAELDNEEWLGPGEGRINALESFLSHDLSTQKLANQQHEVMLESLRKQHQEEYMRNRAVLQLVEKEYEEEKRAEEERKRQAEDAARKQREEEQRLADEARGTEERKLQQRKDLEAKEKEAYKLVQISAPQSLENRESLATLLEKYDEDLRAFCDDRAMKDARRGIKKFITLSVQQISATQEQVRKKSMGLIEFLSQQHGIQQKFALVTLASKMVSQCEAQVALIPSFAFPLGEVSTSVGRAYPDFTKLLIGMMQKECPLCIPVLFQPGAKASKNIEFYKAMGFRVDSASKVESEEEYVNRLQGYVRLYAALLQTDTSSQATLGQAWSYLAWLLNDIPACRYSASALDSFLSVAGFRLFGAFRKQFEKMMMYVSTYFLKELSDIRDPDANAVATRLESYIHTQQYRQVPKGRDMPLRDVSSHSRA